MGWSAVSVIHVVPAGGRDFDVEVTDEAAAGTPGRVYRYHVTVDDPVLAALGVAGDDPAVLSALVRESFAFLLDREPPSSILRRFDLSVISTYFPEYPAALKARPPG
jgi:hypothetical protein